MTTIPLTKAQRIGLYRYMQALAKPPLDVQRRIVAVASALGIASLRGENADVEDKATTPVEVETGDAKWIADVIRNVPPPNGDFAFLLVPALDAIDAALTPAKN